VFECGVLFGRVLFFVAFSFLVCKDGIPSAFPFLGFVVDQVSERGVLMREQSGPLQ